MLLCSKRDSPETNPTENVFAIREELSIWIVSRQFC